MARAWIGLGGNIEPRLPHLEAALEALGRPPFALRAQSSVWSSRPVGYADQPDFLNMVVRVETALAPLAVLDALQAVEAARGKATPFRWGPRTLDLDLLWMDGAPVDHPRLVLPHPRMHERAFVLLPLAEIDPDFIHPILKRGVRELIAGLPHGHPKVERLAPAA